MVRKGWACLSGELVVDSRKAFVVSKPLCKQEPVESSELSTSWVSGEGPWGGCGEKHFQPTKGAGPKELERVEGKAEKYGHCAWVRGRGLLERLESPQVVVAVSSVTKVAHGKMKSANLQHNFGLIRRQKMACDKRFPYSWFLRTVSYNLSWFILIWCPWLLALSSFGASLKGVF